MSEIVEHYPHYILGVLKGFNTAMTKSFVESEDYTSEEKTKLSMYLKAVDNYSEDVRGTTVSDEDPLAKLFVFPNGFVAEKISYTIVEASYMSHIRVFAGHLGYKEDPLMANYTKEKNIPAMCIGVLDVIDDLLTRFWPGSQWGMTFTTFFRSIVPTIKADTEEGMAHALAIIVILICYMHFLVARLDANGIELTSRCPTLTVTTSPQI